MMEANPPQASPAQPREVSWRDRIFQQEDLNFLLTNRVPRIALTRFMGWFSKIEHPWIREASLAAWRWFADDLALHEARKSKFTSLHDCFIRELRDGVRPIDPDPNTLVSPCDAILGAHGRVQGTTAFQAKGFPYLLEDLLQDPELVARYEDGNFLTLRLKSSFYHRFHAPADGNLHQVTYISGDTWNVNPIALKRIERLFCKNERAVLQLDLKGTKESMVLVPVAAILVASMRFRFLNEPLNLQYRGPNRIPCQVSFRKGEELGWFEHGSTILVFTTSGLRLCQHLREGEKLLMGQPLLQR